MKKNFVKIALVFSIFAFLNVTVFAEDAVVTSVKGKVEVSHGGDVWKTLAVGDKVSESDIVSTGFQSEARIKYNGSVMLLGALTRVTLNQMSSNASSDKVDVFLNTGAVRSKVTHTEDRKVSYNVRGPVAVASVRGTDFTCFASGVVRCTEGAVAVYPAKVFEAENPSDSEEPEAEAEENEESEESAEPAEEDNQNENEGPDESTEPPEAPAGDTPSQDAEPPQGPANATTPANEISQNAPAGAVVVGQNQETSFTAGGKAQKPLDVSTKNIEKAKNQVSNNASKEAVSTGGNSDVPGTVEPPKTTGKIIVNVIIED